MITSPSIWGSLTDLANNGIFDVTNAGPPVNGTTGAGFLGPGTYLYDNVNQVVYVQQGTLASPIWMPYSMNDNTQNASGTVQNTEYVLNSITLPANFLKGVRGVTVEWWGALAANANAKNVKFYFGATAVVTVTGSVANAKDVYGTLTVLRTGASAQTGVAQIQIDTATNPNMAKNGAIAETDTAAIVVSVKSANTAAAAASGTGFGMACSILM